MYLHERAAATNITTNKLRGKVHSASVGAWTKPRTPKSTRYIVSKAVLYILQICILWQKYLIVNFLRGLLARALSQTLLGAHTPGIRGSAPCRERSREVIGGSSRPWLSSLMGRVALMRGGIAEGRCIPECLRKTLADAGFTLYYECPCTRGLTIPDSGSGARSEWCIPLVM